ncbi:hypothetical protein GCM10010383_69790 [Streptomyces lomondensis]|uniref:Uncharacterized protein n=1 Tax=Streptomyces lomondensis TaxID=68229 RepID=A0ABQ2XRL4_9ACTN|nr:hypothetical protein GCM10010383_69790 [Streptomyces lomondensis]
MEDWISWLALAPVALSAVGAIAYEVLGRLNVSARLHTLVTALLRFMPTAHRHLPRKRHEDAHDE